MIDKSTQASTDKQLDDALRYNAYAETLWTRIQRALAHDATTGRPLGDDPLVVGIFGEWGAGKSHLLGLVRAHAIRQLAEQKKLRENDAGFDLTVPVTFQPWKYEHEPYLHVPLLLHVVNALKDALREPPDVTAKVAKVASTAVNTVQQVAKPTGKLLGVAKNSFPIVKKILSSISIFGVSIDLPDEWEDWLESAVETAEGVGEHAKGDKPKDITKHVPTASNDGLLFYRVHELLAALTRPGTYAKRKDLFGDVQVTKATRVNFVVLVDDLDRCLPEKAVATLELIKTVFNVESFAFVLALDDEVIERGIAHRYSEYALKGRRSEMPITGFEYLEKIVHLPFRLPALTRGQAQRFLCAREATIVQDEAQRWFVRATPETMAEPTSNGEVGSTHPVGDVRVVLAGAARPWWARDVANRGSDAEAAKFDSPHLRLVLESFEGFVPRKLLRVVELWHQIVRVQQSRANELSGAAGASASPTFSWTRRTPEGTLVPLDTRVIFALTLLQLFQPELFRFMRRRPDAFPALLGAFDSNKPGEPAMFLNARQGDMALWRWAASGEAASNVPEAHDSASALHRIASFTGAVAQSGDSVDNAASDIPARRYMAERVRIGLAERLVEHHAAQRHLFNPLRLFHELSQQLPGDALAQMAAVGFEAYFAVLAQIEPPKAARVVEVEKSASIGVFGEITVTRSEPARRTGDRQAFAVAETQQLATVLLSPDPAQRANLRDRFALRDGEVIRAEDVTAIASTLTNSGAAAGDGKALRWRIAALAAIAPWVDWSDGGGSLLAAVAGQKVTADFLRLNSEAQVAALAGALAAKGGTDEGPALRAEFGDLLNRFAGGDPRFDSTPPFLMKNRWGKNSDKDEPINGFVQIHMGNGAEDFLIARTATTVAQFARFVDAGLPGGTKQRHARAPEGWDEQLPFGNRPVVGVNWFTARAYCRWLTESAAEDIGNRLVALPTEWQWERAARQLSDGTAHRAKFPWGSDDEKEVNRYGNTDDSGIRRVAAVGCFEPTGSGLYDMAGNVWEWMDNEFDKTVGQSLRGIPEGGTVKSPALRGGSWFYTPEHAACSYRGGILPVDWYFSIGFRVVLSLAEKRSVTSEP